VTGSDLVPGFSFQPSRQPKKRPVKSKKKHNSSPQRTQRTPRKKILNNLCELRVLCGEIFLENGIGYCEVLYEMNIPQRQRLTTINTYLADSNQFSFIISSCYSILEIRMTDNPTLA
jgi:hypothetical protein